MNKKDIAAFRRQLKVENDLLHIKEIFNVYIMKDSSEIYHEECTPFDMLEREQQELFMNNFKKTLAGQLDQKLFELKFQQDVENSSQFILNEALMLKDTESWKIKIHEMVEKMLQLRQHDQDIVLTFIRGEYFKTAKAKSSEDDVHERDNVYANTFIMCAINTTQESKKELLFDYVEKTFKYNYVVDPIINLNAPLGGFLFPCFSEGVANVNHILYSTGNSKELDFAFIDDVLNAEEAMTAEEDKVIFEEVVKDLAGNQMTTSKLGAVYEEVQRVIEETDPDETPVIDYRDVENVLQSSGIENVEKEKVEAAFEKVIDNPPFELRANHVIPKYNTKSIKIETKVADIKISPQDLRYVRQMRLNGKLCLVVEIDENTMIEGFEMIPEEKFEDE